MSVFNVYHLLLYIIPIPDKLVPSIFRLLSEYGHSITDCLVVLLLLCFVVTFVQDQSIGVFALSNWPSVKCVMSGSGETLDLVAISLVTVW